MALEELFPRGTVDIPSVLDRLRQVAGELRLPLCERTRVYNTRRATELGKWAQEQGRGDAFHDAVFRAYFGEGLNIGDMKVLKKICSPLGLDPDVAEGVLVEGSCRAAVDADWLYAKRLGITAVPTFLAAGRAVVGAQPYEILEKLVTLARGKG
jgi:predicted DsbA family dithiol-disulfide isomerase